MTHAHHITWDELVALAAKKEAITSYDGYLLCSRDRKLNVADAYTKYLNSVDLALEKNPEDVPLKVSVAYRLRQLEKQHFHWGNTHYPAAERRNDKNKPFTWSHTALSQFKTCPRQYAAARFYLTTKFEETEATRWGNRVHKALELRLRRGSPLPKEMQKWEKYCKAFEANAQKLGATIHPELQLAITRNFHIVDWFAKDAWGRCAGDVVIDAGDTVFCYDWKGLPLDTKIPTKNGWTTIGELSVGTKIFAGDGSLCSVVGKSEVFNRKCFKITFRDSATVVCDDQHLWSVLTGYNNAPSVMSAQEIFDMKQAGKKVGMPVAEPAQYQDKELPIDPYLLGCWLGDGANRGGTICKPNPSMFAEFVERGYVIGKDISHVDRCREHTIYNLTGKLRKLDLLHNKHIPDIYLQAGLEQRRDLIRGLMDTDGTWNPLRKQAIFTSCSKRLALDITELLSSVGEKAYMVTLNKHGFGKDVIGYDVIFTPRLSIPFKHHKKTADVSLEKRAWVKSSTRYVKTIEEIPSVPTQCIAVDSEDHTYLCTERYLVTHNTGKIREDSEQLATNAAFFALKYPEAKKFVTRYVWLEHDQITGQDFTAEEIPDIWNDRLSQIVNIMECWDNKDFPCRRSGLCNGWCQVTDCENWRPKR